MAVNDVFRLSIEGISPAFGNQLVIVQHYEQLAPVTGDVPTALVDDWLSDASESFQGTFSSGGAITRFTVRQVRGGNSLYERVLDTPLNGGRSGTPLPPQAPALIAWKTGLAGKSRMGRSYMWPAVVTDQNSGSLTSGYITDLQSYVTDALAIGSDGSGGFRFGLTVWSRKASISTRVFSGVVRPFTKSQRRRSIGVGS